MRSRYTFCFLILVLGVSTSCNKPKDSTKPSTESVPHASLFRLHFVGTTQLTTDTNAMTWVSMSVLPASQALWQQTIQKISKAPYQFRQPQIKSTNDFAAVFQELIADAVRAESFVEITGDNNRMTECELAFRLPADRAVYWQTNLLAIMESWTQRRGQPIPAGVGGWEMKSSKNRSAFRLIRSGAWTIIGWGMGEFPLQEKLLAQIKRTGSLSAPRPDILPNAKGASWLEVFVDVPNLPPTFPFSPLAGSIASAKTVSQKELPAIHLSLTGRASDLRINGSLSFREPFAWKTEPWQVPTNLIRDPIIGFTAVQGLAPLLKRYQDSLGLQLDSMPNQFYLWAGALIPVQTFAAAPMEDAPGYLQNLGPQIVQRLNPLLHATNDAGMLVMGTNSAGIATLQWTDIPPFVVPFFSTAQDGGRDFLFAGVHHNMPEPNPPPPALFHQLTSRTNLVYYDWEITGEHIYAWRHVVNIFRHFFGRPRLRPEAASITWMNAVSNRLGNTITEITRTDSNQISFVRNGAVGLTSIELLALAHWLESPHFPISKGDSVPPTNLPVAIPER